MYMGERLKDSDACKNFVKTVLSNYQLPYITISPTFSICKKHGYIQWEHDYCPKCDSEIWYEWEKFDNELREKYTDDADKMKAVSETKI
jgi:ribonucleoside-triphosphate reductase